MGPRLNRARNKDNDPPRTQIARLDRKKARSDCKKAAKLDRLKEIIEREKGFRDAMGGEVAILNNMDRQTPKFDSQGFQEYHERSLNERQRSLIKDALSSFPRRLPCWVGSTAFFLFEFASGYAVFEVHGVNELHLSNLNEPSALNFKSHEKYIKRYDQIFTLRAFHPFPSTDDALVQMNAISNSTLSQQLKNFLVDNLPNPFDGETSYYVSTCDPELEINITNTMIMSTLGGVKSNNVMRGLRMNIDKFIDGLELKDVEKAQLNLARLYNRQMCTTTHVESSMVASSSSFQRVVVVPHRFEGVFIAKGKEDFICTKNLVPGEALYGEEFIFVQNEDGTDVEYRVWNPLRSKLATAILCGVTNIWVKPGSRILYLGDDVCQNTISHLSDLVGLDGLVYVVGVSDVAVNMAEKRSNVITVFEKPSCYWKYRMVVGMVDVIYADLIYPHEVYTIINNASFYLRAGGHYMVYTQVNNIYSTSRGKDPFANHHQRKEFTPIEVVMLEPIDRAYAMAVGGFRMLEE